MAVPSLSGLAAEYPRARAIARAYTSGGNTLQAIGELFGLHHSRTSRIVRKMRQAARPGPSRPAI